MLQMLQNVANVEKCCKTMWFASRRHVMKPYGLLHFRWICYTLADRAGAQPVCASAIAFVELVDMVDDHAPQKSEIPDRKTRKDTSILVRRVWKFQLKHHFWSVNSLGNHTVNKLHRFGVVFVGFDRADFIFRAFAKIFWIRLALPHFSCIHFFYWWVSLLGEILDLLSKMTSKTWGRRDGNAQSKHISLV